MDLSDILAGDNAYVKTKEAEALEILGVHTVPAMKTLDGLKREFGHVVPSRELVMLVSPAEGELYKDGKRKATRILFDAYAEITIRQIRDPEAFIELLRAIQEKVVATMTFPCSAPAQAEVTLIDKYEAELCRLAWVKTAWERASISTSNAAMTLPKPSLIQIVLRRLRALLSSGRSITQPSAAEKMSASRPATPGSSPHEARVELAESTVPAQPTTAANGQTGTDRRAAIDAFIGKLAEAGHRITRKDIWTVAGYEDPTEFERFQRGASRATRSAAMAFNRVLNMEPRDFIQLLEKKSSPK